MTSSARTSKEPQNKNIGSSQRIPKFYRASLGHYNKELLKVIGGAKSQGRPGCEGLRADSPAAR